MKTSVIDGELFFKDEISGEIIWKWKPYDRNVKRAIFIPSRNVIFVLLNWRDHPEQYPDKNIFCMDINKNILWYADLPVRDKAWYMGMSYHNHRIIANTPEYKVEIDPYDGHVISENWTK